MRRIPQPQCRRNKQPQVVSQLATRNNQALTENQKACRVYVPNKEKQMSQSSTRSVASSNNRGGAQAARLRAEEQDEEEVVVVDNDGKTHNHVLSTNNRARPAPLVPNNPAWQQPCQGHVPDRVIVTVPPSLHPTSAITQARRMAIPGRSSRSSPSTQSSQAIPIPTASPRSSYIRRWFPATLQH